MKAKDKHRDKLLKYLSNPDNEWIGREALATQVIGYKSPNTLWTTFSAAELDQIETEALSNRRKRYARQLALVDVGQIKAAREGNPQAAKLVYQRFEGWMEKSSVDVDVSIQVIDRFLPEGEK